MTSAPGNNQKLIEISIDISGYAFNIDGKEIAIYESFNKMDVWLFMNITIAIEQCLFNQQYTDTKEGLHYQTSIFCDMCDLFIQQENDIVIRIISQFSDDSDKVEATCDAIAFYTELLKVTKTHIEFVKTQPELKKQYDDTRFTSYTLEQWEHSLGKLSQLLEKHYGFTFVK